MPFDELKTLLSYLGTLGIGGLAGAGVLYLLLKSFLPKYFAEKAKNLATKEDIAGITREVEKAKNLATKEDIAEITKEVESVKAEFAIHLQELQHHKTLLTEGFKSNLSKQEELARSANTAVVDLTKRLASGSHVISWLSWNATQSGYLFSSKDFESYELQMLAVLSDLVGLQASVAALDAAKFDALSPFAEEIYERDVAVAKAKPIVLNATSPNLAQGMRALQEIYFASIEFDRRLLVTVKNLLAQ